MNFIFEYSRALKGNIKGHCFIFELFRLQDEISSVLEGFAVKQFERFMLISCDIINDGYLQGFLKITHLK